MKLRLDLLEHLTTEDVIEEAQATVHRFKPEPLFSKTGTGSLLSASIEERASEVKRSMELAKRLVQRAKQAGSRTEHARQYSPRPSTCFALTIGAHPSSFSTETLFPLLHAAWPKPCSLTSLRSDAGKSFLV
jgi:hypothetical protein